MSDRVKPMSCAQVRLVDRIAMDELGLPGVALMENAGRGATDELLRHGAGKRVLIACGKGNNAGDGYVMARHLELAGVEPVVFAASADDLPGDAGINQAVWRASGGLVTVWRPGQFATQGPYDWVIDALLGTGTRGAPRAPLDAMIRELNTLSGRKLAVDLPSGLDGDTGQAADPTFRADLTCTFVAPKTGFARASQWVGEVCVVDIGVPRAAIRRAREEVA
ncbi:MAG: NAD(P)H-hydrate epimerase [Planctomycetales bacterium]|nr:NAD(P)H-hydrate epimerase [Planctomycetales bacterium]